MNSKGQKVLEFVGLVATSVISTLITNIMTKREIEEQVNKHFEALEANECQE